MQEMVTLVVVVVVVSYHPGSNGVMISVECLLQLLSIRTTALENTWRGTLLVAVRNESTLSVTVENFLSRLVCDHANCVN